MNDSVGHRSYFIIVSANKRRLRSNRSVEVVPSKRKLTEDEDDIELSDVISRSSRIGTSKMGQILNRIKELERNSEIVDGDSSICIICPENKRNILLLPCHHLHLCQSCWYILKVNSISSKPDSYFDEENDADDYDMLPKCPVCRCGIEKDIPVKG